MGSGQLFLFGQDVLSAGLDANSTTSVIVAQIGDSIAGTVESDNCEWWQHAGLASIPSSPTPDGKAAQCLAIRQTDRPVVFASRDLRMSQIYGNLKPGETCLYAGGATGTAQGKVLLKADGSVTLGTTDSNAAGGNAIFLRVSPANGLEFVSPWGTMSFGPNGFKLRVGAFGPEIRAYIMAPALPGPLSALQSVIKVKGAFVKIDGTSVMLGPDTPATIWMPAAYGPDPAPGPLALLGITSSSVKIASP